MSALVTIAKDRHHSRSASPTSTGTAEVTGAHSRSVNYLLAGIRLALGFIFFWAFIDKLFGLGHSTTSAKSWLNGGSPTAGFLGKAATGPFTSFYHSLAGTTFADVLFMAALAGVGGALLLGIGMRIAAGSGALLLVFMWMASLPLDNNPFMDDHIVYAIVLIGLAATHAGDTLGLGRRWAESNLVHRFPALR